MGRRPGQNDTDYSPNISFQKNLLGQSERKTASCAQMLPDSESLIEHKRRLKDTRARVLDRQINLTKYGFPSTNEEKNNNAIKNTVMHDNDPEIENEILVNKTNHVQNAVKLTR
jgi:hypothetical protein